MTGHLWGKSKYDATRRRRYRHCIIGKHQCTAVQSVAGRTKPKGWT